MAEPVVLSGSSIATYLRCAKQWYYAYVERIRTRPNLKAALGIAAHEALEVDLGQKIKSRIHVPLDVIQDAFVDAYKESSYDAVEKPDKGETIPLYEAKGLKSVELWQNQVGPTYQPVLIEQHGQFTIKVDDGDPIPYDWTLDVLDEAGIIKDHKFVSRTPDSMSTYVLNMVGYAVGERRRTPGFIEAGVQLDHIVQTKEPKYVPIPNPEKGEVLAPVTDDDIIAFSGVVDDVHRGIQAGSFPPTGLKSNACTWCGYVQICPAYRGPRRK